MTREEYEAAKRKAAVIYELKAVADMDRDGATKRERDNAKRRFDFAAAQLLKWDNDGFWTPHEEWFYNTFHKDSDDTSAVSAL